MRTEGAVGRAGTTMVVPIRPHPHLRPHCGCDRGRCCGVSRAYHCPSGGVMQMVAWTTASIVGWILAAVIAQQEDVRGGERV